MIGYLFRAARLGATLRAIYRGRILQRCWNALIGRQAARLLRKVYR